MFYDFSSHVVTPVNRECPALSIRYTAGNVENATGILQPGGDSAVLTYNHGGEPPVIILDMGPTSPGGYPVFRVSASEGPAVLRIAYSDSFLPIIDKNHGANGDFKRGCCKYLGVELPVLPANPGRFELYTLHGQGEYLSPLIQGQQRFVRLQLEHPGSQVMLDYFYIHYTSDMSPVEGGFVCDNNRLTKLWYYSVYTFQLASFSSPAWDTLNGWLFPRALTKGCDAGIAKALTHATDYIFSFTARISRNPYAISGIGFTFRAPDRENGYVWRLDLDGRLHVQKRVATRYIELKSPVSIGEITDNRDYCISVEVQGNRFTTRLDGVIIDETEDNTFPIGSIGFCPSHEKWAIVKDCKVSTLDGTILLQDDFSGELDAWEYTVTPPFVSDGAKRDRLPWSGDLDWAGRNSYYSIRNHKYMLGALDLLAFHQNDEGFIFGTCYPENTIKPVGREYGYYESDIFSAWFVPALADYFLYTGDRKNTARLYASARMTLEYLWRFVEGDGLFNQRYETSKGLWDHALGDYGRHAYNNMIVYDAFCEGAFLARHLGLDADAKIHTARAAHIEQGIRRHLIASEGWLVKSVDERDFCHMANSYALAIGFFDREVASRVMQVIINRQPETGKILSTNIRGAYLYDLEAEGWFQLTEYHKVSTDWGYTGGVGWLEMFGDDDVPHTTYECMTYPPHFPGNGESWGDMSHPDTGMAHILSGCILGVLPLEPGFTRFEICPHMYGLRHAAGIVPIPDGCIEVDIHNKPDEFTVRFRQTGSFQQGSLLLPLGDGGYATKDGKQINYCIVNGRACIDLSVYGDGLYQVINQKI